MASFRILFVVKNLELNRASRRGRVLCVGERLGTLFLKVLLSPASSSDGLSSVAQQGAKESISRRGKVLCVLNLGQIFCATMRRAPGANFWPSRGLVAAPLNLNVPLTSNVGRAGLMQIKAVSKNNAAPQLTCLLLLMFVCLFARGRSILSRTQAKGRLPCYATRRKFH